MTYLIFITKNGELFSTKTSCIPRIGETINLDIVQSTSLYRVRDVRHNFCTGHNIDKYPFQSVSVFLENKDPLN